MSDLCLAALVLFLAQPAPQVLTLEIRVFHGTQDVTTETRVAIHRAGDRGHPIAQISRGRSHQLLKVPPGLYDAQAVQEHDGRVVNIRWAERLVVMPYPDEEGHHLEVINFVSGYGALQIRRASGDARPEDFALFGSRGRGQPAPGAAAPDGRRYALFVAPAGTYDIQVKGDARDAWHNGIDVPLDRTRLWIAP